MIWSRGPPPSGSIGSWCSLIARLLGDGFPAKGRYHPPLSCHRNAAAACLMPGRKHCRDRLADGRVIKMKWMDFLERRFGRLGIPRLILYVVAGKAITYVASLAYPAFPSALVLDPQAVRAGEAWRLVTYLFLPQFGHPLLVVIQLYFTLLIGNALEAVWGPFRFTAYYFMGAAATAILAMTPLYIVATPFYVEVSLFLAFATLFPDAIFMLFFILPMKAKWFAWATVVLLGILLASTNMAGRLAIVVALANYLLFFWQLLFHRVVQLTRSGRLPVPPPLSFRKTVHKCTVCGRTELDDRELGFRICACAECGEGREFCEVHLKDHLKGIGRA